jgi:hypothetical protein
VGAPHQEIARHREEASNEELTATEPGILARVTRWS